MMGFRSAPVQIWDGGLLFFVHPHLLIWFVKLKLKDLWVYCKYLQSWSKYDFRNEIKILKNVRRRISVERICALLIYSSLIKLKSVYSLYLKLSIFYYAVSRD